MCLSANIANLINNFKYTYYFLMQKFDERPVVLMTLSSNMKMFTMFFIYQIRHEVLFSTCTTTFFTF